jgi:hypothetical protein
MMQARVRARACIMAQLAAVGRSLATGELGGTLRSEAGVRDLVAHIRALTGVELRLAF